MSFIQRALPLHRQPTTKALLKPTFIPRSTFLLRSNQKTAPALRSSQRNFACSLPAPPKRHGSFSISAQRFTLKRPSNISQGNKAYQYTKLSAFQRNIQIDSSCSITSRSPPTFASPTHKQGHHFVKNLNPALSRQSLQPPLSRQSLQPPLSRQSLQPPRSLQSLQPLRNLQSLQPVRNLQSLQPVRNLHTRASALTTSTFLMAKKIPHLSKNRCLQFPFFLLLLPLIVPFANAQAHDPMEGRTQPFFSPQRLFGTSNRDTGSDYRANHPGLSESSTINENLRFYSNTLQSTPDGDFIENILTKWKGQYRLLEFHHSYIQWLFPIREASGVNPYAFPLQKHEAEEIKQNPELQNRAIRAYELMLDFYGMKFSDPEKKDGKLERTENYEMLYQNLNSKFHNYLRITRILKFLGEVGLEHYKVPFLDFVINEMYEHGNLRNAWTSMKDFWVPVIRSDSDRLRMQRFIAEKGKP